MIPRSVNKAIVSKESRQLWVQWGLDVTLTCRLIAVSVLSWIVCAIDALMAACVGSPKYRRCRGPLNILPDVLGASITVKRPRGQRLRLWTP
jgi:hypothetical protein